MKSIPFSTTELFGQSTYRISKRTISTFKEFVIFFFRCRTVARNAGLQETMGKLATLKTKEDQVNGFEFYAVPNELSVLLM